MSPTVVEWNTEHVTYYGGVEIQNMSPTVISILFFTYSLTSSVISSTACLEIERIFVCYDSLVRPPLQIP
jgi:hypothetical protein